jgi:hypothetical protein
MGYQMEYERGYLWAYLSQAQKSLVLLAPILSAHMMDKQMVCGRVLLIPKGK